ncbi:hypothetical protein H2248_002918 [Termitomyces sp. 'cryptogamus']|nr:hypothetical protein H2248_002918 [Termitomyces sp. 'cryptogamus']
MEVTLGNTMGAAFIGAMIAAILYGVTNLQAFLYYQNYRNDWYIHKYSVALLWALDTLHLSLTIAAIYHYLIRSFGSLEAVQLVVWSFKLGVAINVIIIVAVQTLYALRVWKLGRLYHRIWPIVVATIVASGYAIGIILAVKTYETSTFADLSTISWVIYAAFAWTTGIDVVIAIAMCYYLTRSKSGLSGTDSKIVMIIRMVLISGFLTSACSLTALITYVAMPNTLVFLGIEFLLTKLYINSFLAMLNARKSIRETDVSTGLVSFSGIFNVPTNTSEVGQSNDQASPHGLGESKTAVPISPLSPYRKEENSQSKLYDPNPSVDSVDEGILPHSHMNMGAYAV